MLNNIKIFKEILRMKKYTRIVTHLIKLAYIINRQNRINKSQSKYDPNKFFNAFVKHLALRNNAALAKKLGVSSMIIGKIRQLTQPVSGTILILIHEKTGLSFSELRRFMGERRKKFRIKSAQL